MKSTAASILVTRPKRSHRRSKRGEGQRIFGLQAHHASLIALVLAGVVWGLFVVAVQMPTSGSIKMPAGQSSQR